MLNGEVIRLDGAIRMAPKKAPSGHPKPGASANYRAMSAGNDSAVIRRLAAILIADVVGYTRLMERDDTGTFSRLRTIRDEVVDPAIVSHGGRIVKTAGDGLLAEFASALSALRAAVQVQREMGARNADVSADVCIEYRIGINLGDVDDRRQRSGRGRHQCRLQAGSTM